MSKLILSALLAGSVALAATAVADDKGGSKLDGGYTIVSGEGNGKAVPAEKIQGGTVRFAGNRITGTDKDKKDFFAASYTLDQTKTPWVIKMTSTAPKTAETTGLVKKEGDTITLIYALPGGPTPTEFKTKEGQNMFMLKNLNPGGKGK
jgi:uncharacterized protein (TIGR03067 family)